jgi:membrane associated rhomboid family serine protease
MTRLPARTLFSRYAVAWTYLACFVLAQLIYAVLPAHDQSALLQWASTDVVNLRHDPVGSMVTSAFLSGGFAGAWPFMIALALFGANRALGNWRTAVVCAAGHVVGTLVSEGILDYRVTNDPLPASETRILDVGPSYVVVTAIAVAMLYGSWWARVAATVDLAALVFVGQIFAGLSALEVAAVGHVTAIVVAVLLGSLLAWQARRHRPAVRDGPPGARSPARRQDMKAVD